MGIHLSCLLSACWPQSLQSKHLMHRSFLSSPLCLCGLQQGCDHHPLMLQVETCLLQSEKPRGFARGFEPERIIGATDSSGELMFLMKW